MPRSKSVNKGRLRALPLARTVGFRWISGTRSFGVGDPTVAIRKARNLCIVCGNGDSLNPWCNPGRAMPNCRQGPSSHILASCLEVGKQTVSDWVSCQDHVPEGFPERSQQPRRSHVAVAAQCHHDRSGGEQSLECQSRITFLGYEGSLGGILFRFRLLPHRRRPTNLQLHISACG